MTSDQVNRPRDGSVAFFYDIATERFDDIKDLADEFSTDDEERERFFDIVGRDMDVARIVAMPSLLVSYNKVPAGAKVKRHRHGTNQITYVLKGSLRYGNRVTSEGQGLFGPNTYYSWAAGPEGCEFLEIHDGFPEILD